MRFYFCDKYIYIDGNKKEVERDMYVALMYFRWGFMIRIGMKSEKTILRISSSISP